MIGKGIRLIFTERNISFKLKTFDELYPVIKIFPHLDKVDYEIFGGMIVMNLTLNHLVMPEFRHLIYIVRNEQIYKETIKKHDSLYIQPFLNHGFSCLSGNGNLYLVRVSGSVNLATQRELSYMANVERVFNETKCWFD